MRPAGDRDPIAFHWNMPPCLYLVQGCFVKERIAGRLSDFDITNTPVGA
jgi:hypothetical protein